MEHSLHQISNCDKKMGCYEPHLRIVNHQETCCLLDTGTCWLLQTKHALRSDSADQHPESGMMNRMGDA